MDHEHHHPSSIESSNNNKLSQSSPSHHTGHNQHIGHNVEMFRNKFWVCLIISIPVLLWDPMIQQWFKYQLPSSLVPISSCSFWNYRFHLWWMDFPTGAYKSLF